MVSLWPWKKDNSAASFEKTLSALSEKITRTQTRLEKTGASSRRVKVLVTLYSTFAYLVLAIVCLLVIGREKMGQYELASLVTGPFLIYGVRKTISAIYNYRIDALSTKLAGLQEERAQTIQKLKDATKYDSTMELIEKYGGEGRPKSSGKGAADEGDGEGRSPKGKKGRHSAAAAAGAEPPRRTTMPIPATANIQRGQNAASPPQQRPPHDAMEPSAEFAPNSGYEGPPPAPERPRQPPQEHGQHAPMPHGGQAESHWYDRIFDVLLGEDEFSPKNRIVLICQTCRVVNGQAPPGTQALSELGIWRCMSCGAANGTEKEDEGKRIVREVLEDGGGAETGDGQDGVAGEESEVEMQEVGNAEGQDEGPAASVRKRRGKGRK